MSVGACSTQVLSQRSIFQLFFLINLLNDFSSAKNDQTFNDFKDFKHLKAGLMTDLTLAVVKTKTLMSLYV